MKSKLTVLTALLAAFCALVPAHADTRLKDIAVIEGVRGNQLVGYGLVVGLAGTGDGTGTAFTPQTVVSMLQKFGVSSSAAALQLKNVAAVMVTATLPPFVHNGNAIDVTVSSMGDASSLQGGTLLQTPLQAANGQVYAVAQGSISIGGFSAGSGGGGGATVVKNHPTAGRVPGGALVEQDVPTTLAGVSSNQIMISLNEPDWTTSARIADAIRANLPDGATGATALDPATVQVDFRPGTEPVSLISQLECLTVQTDEAAKIVINERDGTVVLGGNVTVTECAIAHGDLTVQITNDPIVVPGDGPRGKPAVVPHETVTVDEQNAHLIAVPSSSTIDRVVKSLNLLGVTPRDLIAILQAMKDAGALNADVEVE